MPMTLNVKTPVVVNFNQFALENHVEKALRRAWALSNHTTIDASDLLKGALLVARSNTSPAFRKLVALLPNIDVPSAVAKKGGVPLELAAVPVSVGVANSFSVAEGFLKEGNRVWGRDYITLALLANSDPSLNEITEEAGTNVDAVRREWFDFICASDAHRKPDAWRRWWRGAGLTPPGGDPASAPRPPESAYLFTWDPRRYPFHDLDSHIRTIQSAGSSVIRWSTGGRRTLSIGDRVFLVRQDDDHRGLVGVGEIAGDVIEAPHWDENERKQGRISTLVDVRWSALSREPLIDLSSLMETGDTNVWLSPTGGVQLEPAVAKQMESAWPRAWERRLSGLPDDRLPAIEPKHWIARFDADTGTSDDRLKIDRYVNAFARVMASRALTPPLSIGLFGDWGSGKTFFMDRLYQKIEKLSNAPSTDPPLYWNRICQMRFNAWHYTETNLWASLVTTIFNELCTFLDPPETDAEQFNRLLNQLEVVQALRKEAQDKLKAASEQHDLAAKKVDDAEQALRTLPSPPALSDAELRKVLGQQLSAVLPQDAASLAQLLDEAGAWSGREDFTEAAKRVRAGQATVDDAQKLLAEAGALSSNAGFWWRVLSGAKLYKTASFWIVILLLLAIPIVMVWALSKGVPESWAHAWALFGETITMLGAAIAWSRSRLARASAVFDKLASSRVGIERQIEEARSRDRIAFEASRDEALAREKATRELLEQARREEAQAGEAEQKARDALRDSTTQARLGRFIRERTSSADYEKHLGLIAMIHRDFSKLSRLMMSGRGQEDTSSELPRIDRIILYIDDLDRCHPPDKVVRVLEAVHLLLFFPLFVVVVGVDSRWVSRALYKHYEGMLADEAIQTAQGNELQRPPAESQDFLEKIFQVPFWLRRMDPNAVQRLLHQMISAAEVEAAPLQPAPEPATDTTHPAAAIAPPASGVLTDATTPENPGRAAAKRTTAEAEIDEDVVEPLATPSESLRITERELQFMDQVAPLMPRTPRSVKRFVNIYRLYKAALAPTAFARFVGTPDRPGNFQAVQVLLALVTGMPRFAQRVFAALYANDGTATPKQLSTLVDRLDEQKDDDESWQTTLDALREFSRRNNLDLADLREVATLVSRYSVHHMISKAPGEAGLG